ncbi:MAG: membrane integrity-associated transporter subunit PqiC [Methylococcaceae bacterium]
MINSFFVPLSVVAIILAIAGCESSPRAKFYILNTIDRNVVVKDVPRKYHMVAVKVGPVSIPDTLNHSQIVTRSGRNMLTLDEFNLWGGDFQSDIQRIVGENISILLPTDQVVLSSEVSLVSEDFQVLINVRELYGKLGGTVILNADWTVIHKGKEKTITAKKSVFQGNSDGTDYQAYVGAQSRLLAKLSQEITDEIRRQLNK